METVRAGGGVIVRDGQLLVVHRSRYGDWSLPKGKLEPGETWEQAALREVEEETGLVCTLGDEVGSTRYRDGRGRDKVVRYFRMSAEGEARACNEVDEVRWVPLAEAAGILTHPPDAELVSGLGGDRLEPG